MSGIWQMDNSRRMMLQVKKIINTENKKKLVANFFSLSVLQGVNYILPLITLPYLVRVLGVEYFGVLAFATATVAYFHLITDYGFNLTATREISVHRDNKAKVVEIFSSVIIIKIIFMIFSLMILFIIVFSFDVFLKYWEIYFFTFGAVIGQVLFPIWFFQGMEQMKYITYLNILAKSIFTIAIFIFVQNKEDYYIVPILTSLGFMVAGIWSLVIIHKKFNIKFEFQNIDIIKYYLIDGWYVFISNLANGFYTYSTIFILGVFTNNVIVGYYSAGERLIKVVQSFFTPLFQTIYPYIATKKVQSINSSMTIIRKLTIIIGLFSLFISFLVFYNAELLVSVVLGEHFGDSIAVVKILSLLPLTYALSNIFGVQTMLNHGRQKAYSKIFIYATVLNLVLSLVLIPIYKEVGTAATALLTEIFFTIAMFFYLQNTGLKIINIGYRK
jgi:PST family polysaccharide transporter